MTQSDEPDGIQSAEITSDEHITFIGQNDDGTYQWFCAGCDAKGEPAPSPEQPFVEGTKHLRDQRVVD